MKTKLEKGLQSKVNSLIPHMFIVNEIYSGTVSEVNSEFIIVEFLDGGEGKLFLRDFKSYPIFMVGSEVEVRIVKITQENELILSFTGRYMKNQNILQIEYDGIVLLTSHTAVTIYIPELDKVGLRYSKELKRRYRMMLPNQNIKCRVIRIGEEIVINKVSAIIRDGKEVRTFDNKVFIESISKGSQKDFRNFRLGYVYEATICQDNQVILSNSSIKLSLKKPLEDMREGTLLEIRITFISDVPEKIEAEVISVLRRD